MVYFSVPSLKTGGCKAKIASVSVQLYRWIIHLSATNSSKKPPNVHELPKQEPYSCTV